MNDKTANKMKRFEGLVQLQVIEMTREDGPPHAVGAIKKARSFEEADAGLARMRRTAPDEGSHPIRVKVLYSDGVEIVGVYPLQKAKTEDLETWFRRELMGVWKSGGKDSRHAKKFLTEYALGQNNVLDRAEKARAA